VGLSMEFYAGDAAAIGADFTAREFNGIRNGTRALAHADFSLHLSPFDLDILSEVVADRVGGASRLLNNSLVRSVGGASTETGADVVDPAWVRMVALAEEGAVPELTAEWIKRVGAEYRQQLAVTDDALRAVRELIRLCRLAVEKELEVVHTWYL
jgi:hypothetical protein